MWACGGFATAAALIERAAIAAITRQAEIVNEIKIDHRQIFAGSRCHSPGRGFVGGCWGMRRFGLWLSLLPAVLASTSAPADYRITRDHCGHVHEYKAQYNGLRDRGERVIIGGICNSACTPVLGIAPLH